MTDDQQTDQERTEQENNAPAVQADTDGAEAASGRGKVQGTVSGLKASGKLTSEGGERPADAPSAGDPGGMGGAGAPVGTGGRPPGGNSPMAPTDGS